MDRILATHTGSLIRPPELLAFLAAKERGRRLRRAGLRGVPARTRSPTSCSRQVEVGHRRRRRRRDGQGELDHVSVRARQRPRAPPRHARGREHAPAEPRPPGVPRRVRRSSTRSTRRRRARATRPPTAARWMSGRRRTSAVSWVCTGPLTYDRTALDRDIANFKTALAGARRRRGVPPRRRAGERVLAAQRALRRPRRSSCSRSPTRCTRSTRRSSTPACCCRSTTP